MPNPLLSVRIPPDLLQQIDTRAAEEGGDRSKVAIAALEHYLNPSGDSPKLQRLEARVTKLEAALQVQAGSLG
jgi:metal-responsive CopG/Arc/MetJ family transcriptional regulator